MISSFENLLPILGITNFVNVITYGLIGSLVLATISLSYYLIPKLYGREVNYSRLEDITFFGFKISYLLLLINNTVLGLTQVIHGMRGQMQEAQQFTEKGMVLSESY